MKRATITVALLWLPLLAMAQAPSLNVFGFVLRQKLDLPECHSKLAAEIKIYDLIPAVTCFEPAHKLNGYGQPVRRITFSQKETPAIVKNWTAFPLESNGVLIGIHFMTPGVVAQEIVLAQLQTKYGTPTRIERRPIQNALGASFEAISAQWKLEGLQVTFEGVLDKLETGQVYIDLPEATKLRQEWAERDRSSERSL